MSHRIFQTPGNWPGLQELSKFQDPLPLLSKVLLHLLETTGVFASRHMVQVGSEVSQRPALLLLKPEQDFLPCNFSNRPLSIYPQLSFRVADFFQLEPTLRSTKLAWLSLSKAYDSHSNPVSTDPQQEEMEPYISSLRGLWLSY